MTTKDMTVTETTVTFEITHPDLATPIITKIFRTLEETTAWFMSVKAAEKFGYSFKVLAVTYS